MAALVHYRFPTAGALIGALGLGVVALGAAAFVSGVRLPLPSRAPATPAEGTTRYQHEVLVKNASRGCRWQYTADPSSQTAECGDESENVRVVFHNGEVTEYRISARTDPNARPTAVPTSAAFRPPSSSAGAFSSTAAAASANRSLGTPSAPSGPPGAPNAGAPAGAPPTR